MQDTSKGKDIVVAVVGILYLCMLRAISAAESRLLHRELQNKHHSLFLLAELQKKRTQTNAEDPANCSCIHPDCYSGPNSLSAEDRCSSAEKRTTAQWCTLVHHCIRAELIGPIDPDGEGRGKMNHYIPSNRINFQESSQIFCRSLKNLILINSDCIFV